MRNTIAFLAFLCALGIYAQDTGSVKGTIVDLEANNEPLLFANISLDNTNWKTQTNFNGNFELLDIPAGKYELKISFLGYETRTVAVEVLPESSIRIDTGLEAKTLSLGATYEDGDTFGKELSSIAGAETKLP